MPISKHPHEEIEIGDMLVPMVCIQQNYSSELTHYFAAARLVLKVEMICGHKVIHWRYFNDKNFSATNEATMILSGITYDLFKCDK